ncbi:MAG: hypothetical protein AAF441_25865 [Pseudomonadota bacterium]
MTRRSDLITIIDPLPQATLFPALSGPDFQSIWQQISLFGTEGSDVLIATGFIRFVYGLGGDDIILTNAAAGYYYGGNGSDFFFAGAGADYIDGGGQGRGGSDTVDYRNSISSVSVNLETGHAAGGHAAGDTLVNVENLNGSAFEDWLTGDARANILRGLGGDDSIDGGIGNDVIVGGENDFGLLYGDLLTGGTGGDTFVFAYEGDSGGDVSSDIITDFLSGVDTFEFTGFQDAGTFDDLLQNGAVFSGNQSGFSGQQSEIIYSFASDNTLGNFTTVSARFIEDDGLAVHQSDVILLGFVTLQAADFEFV